jgi:hypothetical protein
MEALPIGKDIDTGQYRLITDLDKDLERGLRCNCICVGCSRPLIARMGAKRTHHFAHQRAEDYSSSCGETALHIFVKELLIRDRKAFLPHYVAEHESIDLLLNPFKTTHYSFGKIYHLIEPKAEVDLSELKIKPDIKANIELFDDTYDVAIEVAVTHFVDEEKKEKIINSGLSMVEVDFSGFRKANDLTEQSVRKHLKNNKNWSWQHVSEKLKKALIEIDEGNHKTDLNKRNQHITNWCDRLRINLQTAPNFLIPKYVFSEQVNDPTIELDDGSPQRIKTGYKKPRVGGLVVILDITTVAGGIVELVVDHSDHKIHLPLALSQQGHKALMDASKTHLALNPEIEDLPDVEKLQWSIRWGLNQKAKEYEEKITKELIEQQSKYDSSRKSRLIAQTEKELQKYEGYLSGQRATQHSSKKLDEIKMNARKFWINMKQNDIPVENILQDVENSWIFGCENIWQVYVMYAMCIDPSAHGRAGNIYRELRNSFNLYPLWPIHKLHQNKFKVIDLGYDFDRVINPESVIRSYLDKLVKNGLLVPPYGSEYEKKFRSGSRFVRYKG